MCKIFFFSLIFLFSGATYGGELPLSIKELPVQDGGRLKPYDTFARESLKLVYGRSRFKNHKGEKRSAIEVVSTWMMVPDVWAKKEFIRIDHQELKKALGFEDMGKKFYAPESLLANPRLDVLFRELQGKQEAKEKLNPFYQAVSQLQTKLMTFHSIASGGLRVAPKLLEGGDGESANNPMALEMKSSWLEVAQLPEAQATLFFNLLRNYSKVFTTGEGSEVYLKDLHAFMQRAQDNNPALYADMKKIRMELHYNEFSPFQWSWILYLLAMILVGVSLIFSAGALRYGAWLSLGAAFVLHTYGFALRVYLTERPPVSNMYETVIWVAWGVVIFTAWLSAVKKKSHILLSGAAVATLCMVVADRAPAILDNSLQPLEPVLRSNLWLIIHVMTITLSYAAFFLALGVGNVGLIQVIRGASLNSPVIRDLSDSCYKCLQVGVVLLAAGTILGGVWADYSWGRFWGWDPKETWAFIALLGYLALLHGRLAGWVKHFGLLAGSVISFNLVIMAWYGVNFVLGAGLHSYGFGAGGVEYVALFCGLQMLLVLYAWLVRARPSSQA